MNLVHAPRVLNKLKLASSRVIVVALIIQTFKLPEWHSVYLIILFLPNLLNIQFFNLLGRST